MKILEHESLANRVSFKTGGPARFLVAPTSIEEIVEAQNFSKKQGIPAYLLGKGTNLVFSDKGFPGLVIDLSESFSALQWNGRKVVAQSGALLHTVVGESVKRGLAGIQNLAGIPGTIGGGTYINAGAFGQELKEVVTMVTSIDEEGNLHTRSNAECEFSYRHSAFFNWKETILTTEMELTESEPQALADEMRATLIKRKEKQPLNLPNAGSMFKRPPGNYAGTLIEAAGLKGLKVGGAQVSEKHANFVVNVDGATAQDIWNLTEEIIHKVQAHSGITLEREVIFVGEF